VTSDKNDYLIDESTDPMNSSNGLKSILTMCVLLAACGKASPPRLTPDATSAAIAATSQTSPTTTLTAIPSPSATSSPIPGPTLTPSPTPLFTLDLSRYDPDLFPPLDISHNPPLIARADETVSLVFNVVNPICFSQPLPCSLEGNTHYAYGEGGSVQTIPLANEIIDEMDSLVARLPAVDEKGASLRYSVEFAIPEAGYTQRYPPEGTIDLFATDEFILVELSVENAVQPGDKVYDFFWGFGPDKVRQATYEQYPHRVGPPAIDVSDDGRIAILDPVNGRIIIFNLERGSYSSFPLPFTYNYPADLAFDNQGRLMVCDYQGEEVEGSQGPNPYCYLVDTGGKLLALTPVYVEVPAGITKDLNILDYGDSRLVAPFDEQGKANSREAQRDKGTWELPKRYVESQYPYLVESADVMRGIAFEVHSLSPLGVLTDFERTPEGYIMTFSLSDRMRAVWVDDAGAVLKDVTLPKIEYSEVYLYGQTAVTPDGALFVMSSTRRGIEVHYVAPPPIQGD
jgi:hypothetical protein